jgi:UDP-2,4-diacetamido-2,4,6-trideoxy-beta-L-altropyranose hydrolase
MSAKIKIKSAKVEDVDLLYRWSSDELVRTQSFSSEVIPYETHCNWFEKKLLDAQSTLFIIQIDEIPAGLVRFDEKEGEAIIGVTIDKNYRGKGLGGKFIKVGLEEFFKKSDLTVLAYIKKGNIASVKSFENAGFSLFKEEEINGIGSFIYQIVK